MEATKFTEVGYVGRDVESMIRDLVEVAVAMVRDEKRELVREAAAKQAEERLEAVAAKVGMPAEQVFKTLVVPRPAPAKPMLVMIPADHQLNLKKLAKAAGDQREVRIASPSHPRSGSSSASSIVGGSIRPESMEASKRPNRHW